MDLDDAYANGKYIPHADSYPILWADAAKAWRETQCASGRAELDVAYGPDPRARYDMFFPVHNPLGLLVFVHGGYWKAFDKSLWSHLAAGAVERGWAVAMPSYCLAPEVRISQITAQIAQAIEAAAKKVPGPIVLTGHSAGGHLVARMVCQDSDLADSVRSRLQRVVPISLVSDLRPLLRTSMNADLRLDAAEAARESPLLLAPLDVPVTVWVGAEERPVFLDQARWLAKAWPNAKLRIDPGRHHFDVIDGLATADSPLMHDILG